MSRKVVAMTPDHLAALPHEHGWARAVMEDWGPCGRILLVGGEVAGHALYAPAALVPGADRFPTSPASPDAVLLAALYVDDAARGGGLGRVMVQGVARDLTERRLTALEVFADTRGGRHPDRGLVPVEFAERVGFVVVRPHSTTPRLRMELRAAVTWKDGVEQALERLVRAVRPKPVAPQAQRGLDRRRGALSR